MTNELYKKLVERAIWGFIYCEVENDLADKTQSYKIKDVNQAICEMIEKPAAELLGQDIQKIVKHFDFNYNDFNHFFLGQKSAKLYSKKCKESFEVTSLSLEAGCYALTLTKISEEEDHSKVNTANKDASEFELKYKIEEFEKLFEVLPGLFCVTDIEENYLLINGAWEKLLGLSCDEITRNKLSRIIHSDDIEDTKKALTAMKPNEYLLNYVNRCRNKDGNYHYIQWNCYFDGELIYAVANDISKMKTYETELISQKKFLKTLIDTIPDYVFYKDNEGVYLGCNRAMADIIFQKNEKDVIGKNDGDLLEDKQLAQCFIKQDQEVIDEEKTVIYEDMIIDNQNSQLDLETIKVPFYDEDGNIAGIIGISRDITIRKYAEEQIKESEERFRQLAQSIDEVFWLATDDKMLYISPGYERIWGRSCDSVYSNIRNFRKHIFEEDKIRVFEAFNKDEYKINGCFNEKYRIQKPDGTLRWVWERSFPVRDDKGTIIRRAGIAEDITTLKIAEEVVARTREEMIRVELQKKSMELDQLEELDRLRTDFFANLSHELRTPINLIFASLKMIELDDNDYASSRNQTMPNKYIKIIKQNSYRLMRLINNLIDVTRLDAGFLSLSTSNWDIVDMIKCVTLSVAEYAKNKDISLNFQSDIEHLTIECDPDKIERIMLNLLSNAIKFNNQGGKVDVVMKANDEDIYISVRDNGIGIPESKLEMVFERFKQIDSRLNKEGEGSGIGLSLVKSLVEMHGGEVSVSSVLGFGTEFIIRLPNKITDVKRNTLLDFENDDRDSSRIERIRMEFSDIYGLKF